MKMDTLLLETKCGISLPELLHKLGQAERTFRSRNTAMLAYAKRAHNGTIILLRLHLADEVPCLRDFENLTQKDKLDAEAELYRKRDWLCQSVYRAILLPH